MDIKTHNNKLYFSHVNKSFANLSIKDYKSKLELLKTLPSYRNKGFATTLLLEIIDFLKRKKKCKLLYANPLPLDNDGLKLEELIKFYIKHGFKKSKKSTIYEPYLMVKEL